MSIPNSLHLIIFCSGVSCYFKLMECSRYKTAISFKILKIDQHNLITVPTVLEINCIKSCQFFSIVSVYLQFSHINSLFNLPSSLYRDIQYPSTPMPTNESVVNDNELNSAKAVATSVVGQVDSGRPSNLLSLNQSKAIASPVKESLSNSENPRDDPYYESDWFSGAGIHLIRYGKIEKEVVVDVNREDLSNILCLQINANGSLQPPSFVKGSSREIFIYDQFKDHCPKHFVIINTHEHVHGLAQGGMSGKKKGRRGGKKKRHPYLISFTGGCKAREDGCSTKYVAGITEVDLSMLARGETDSVCIHMRVTGQCTHVWKKKYDRVMGKARQEQINEIALGNGRLMPPARRAAKSLSRVDGHSFAVGNHGGLATDVETQYELSREAKKKLFKDMNLTGDMLVNVINVIEALKEKDKKRRSSRGDSSTDFLGLVHNSSFHNGLHMEIWTKEILKVC